MKKSKLKFLTAAIVVIILFVMTGCSELDEIAGIADMLTSDDSSVVQMEDVPEYDGEPYVAINGNTPDFPFDELTDESFETYSELDTLGRCGTAVANVGKDLMPTEKRGNISSVKPTGWQISKYDFVDGKYLYNRCHLIGFQLTGENANEGNLITGTRYMNVDGMLPFENMIDDYVDETLNHVLYRVTPIYKGDDLIARGVQMEAWSVEDQGEGICFNVFAYNVQPGVEIDYATGNNWLSGKKGAGSQKTEATKGEIRGNRNSHIYHCPGQRAYNEMGNSKNLVVFKTEKDAQKAGYRKAQQ